MKLFMIRWGYSTVLGLCLLLSHTAAIAHSHSAELSPIKTAVSTHLDHVDMGGAHACGLCTHAAQKQLGPVIPSGPQYVSGLGTLGLCEKAVNPKDSVGAIAIRGPPALILT